jgi:hypothetical protein
MRLAGRPRKRGGDQEHLGAGLGQGAEEVRKAQVVQKS